MPKLLQKVPIQGLKDLGHGPLSNCQTFTCTQFVVAIYEKLDPHP